MENETNWNTKRNKHNRSNRKLDIVNRLNSMNTLIERAGGVQNSKTREDKSPFAKSLRKYLDDNATSNPPGQKRTTAPPSALINGLKESSRLKPFSPRKSPEGNNDRESLVQPNTNKQAKESPNARSTRAFLRPGRPHVIAGLDNTTGPIDGFHVQSGNDGQYLPVRGSIFEHVETLNMHLHGLVIRTGTTATGADRNAETDATGRVFGLIPESIAFLRKMALNAYELNSGNQKPNLDPEERPFQFAVVNVLGREDHAKVVRSLQLARNKSDELHLVLENAGAPAGTKISTILYNDAGQPIAFGVRFPDSQFISMTRDGPKAAQHIIYLHSTKSIGGGKSDEKLADGELPFECRSMAKEFEWWMAALAVTGGKIGGIDSTIGGTARTARYAMLVAGLQPQMFAQGAMESIGVDRGDWVQNNLTSEKQEYRANLATTLLRSAYGEAGKRLRGIDIELIDRQDFESRLAREIRSTTAILRTLFMGHPDLMPIKGDISDEIWSRNREQRITEHEWMSIVDKIERKKWDMSRRTELTTSRNLSFSDIEKMANGEGSGYLKEKVQTMMVDMRYLITEKPYLVTNGGFATLTFYVPGQRANGRLSDNLIIRACELLASGITSMGVPKVLTRILPAPKRSIKGNSVLVTLSEEHAGTNILMASNSASGTHDRRTIIQNHKLKEGQRKLPKRKRRYSYRVILDGIIKAHELSGLSSCVKDSELIRAYYRYVYGGEYGLSKVEVGGSNRPVEKIHYNEEII